MIFVVKCFLLCNWIISVIVNWKAVVQLLFRFLQGLSIIGWFLSNSIECIIFLLSSWLGYEFLCSIAHLKRRRTIEAVRISYREGFQSLLKDSDTDVVVDSINETAIYKVWMNDRSVCNELSCHWLCIWLIDHLNELLLHRLFVSSSKCWSLKSYLFLVTRSMNENIFIYTRGIIRSFEKHLLLRCAKPDLFSHLLKSLLSLEIDHIHTYHEMRELAASNHHNVYNYFLCDF